MRSILVLCLQKKRATVSQTFENREMYSQRHYISMGAKVHILFPISEIKDADLEIGVLHNRLSLSSKPRDSIIFWIIWCVLLSQLSILHDLFTLKNSRCSNNCGTHSVYLNCCNSEGKIMRRQKRGVHSILHITCSTEASTQRDGI